MLHKVSDDLNLIKRKTKTLSVNMPSKIGILFIIPHLGGLGGTETYLYRVLKNLDREKFEPFVLHFKTIRRHGKVKTAPEMIRMLNVEVIYIDLKKTFSLKAVKTLFQIKHIIKKRNIGIVQTFHPMGDFYGTIAAKFSGVSRIISNRRDMGFNTPKKMLLVQRQVNHFVSRFIAPCEAVKKKVISDENVKSSRIEVIRNGVNLDVFKNRQKCRQFLAEFGINDHEQLVGVVANLYPIKGVHYLIKSIPIVKNSIENVRFIIVGEGIMHEELKDLARRINVDKSIIFTGKRLDIAPILSSFDLFVNPSLSEGSSNAIIEAMAAGLPVVATNVGGNLELIAHGDSGLLVPPKDEHSIAEAIVRLLNDEPLRLNMGAAARSFAEQNHDINTMMNALEELYIRMMSV
ncbi:MAG: glycosyltransferase [Candidatus Hodarchaeota archaeon]